MNVSLHILKNYSWHCIAWATGIKDVVKVKKGQAVAVTGREGP
jgi:hypothetical protein